MANEQNLRPIRTEGEAREKGKNGGIASGVARKEKKRLERIMRQDLLLQTSDKDWDEIIAKAIERAKKTDIGFNTYTNIVDGKNGSAPSGEINITVATQKDAEAVNFVLSLKP